MFPFDRPTSYGEMLNKIGIFTFLSALGLTWVLAHFSPPAAAFLKSQTTTVEVLTLKVPILFVVPAIVIAVLARVVRLHDKVSDLFGIRVRFDVYRILIPLCGSLQIAVDHQFRDKLVRERKNAMGRTFYKYASFEDPKISKAAVLAAIDRWTWYWILVEFIAVAVLAGAALLVLHAYAGAALVFLVLFFATILFSTYDASCGRLADIQIEEIISDFERANTLRTELSNMRDGV
jgi:hypothetical protein